jgi:hypothetical protein
MSLLQRLETLIDERAAHREAPPTIQPVSRFSTTTEGVKEDEPAMTRSTTVVSRCPQYAEAAVEWVARACPLLPEDRRYLMGRLEILSPAAITQAFHAYVATWREAALQEPAPHRQENVGRRAANIALRHYQD